MVPSHCEDNSADRSLGELWERRFCALVAQHHPWFFTPHQIGRPGGSAAAHAKHDRWRLLLLPDVTIWAAPGAHHEIKHKSPTKFNSYGLEEYRLMALCAFAVETQQTVLYTIHDWKLAGAHNSRASMPNRIGDWRTASVLDLWEQRGQPVRFRTYVGGETKDRPGYYWPVDLWEPLAKHWDRVISPALPLRR